MQLQLPSRAREERRNSVVWGVPKAGQMASGAWVPSPKVSRMASPMTADDKGKPDGSVCEVRFGFAGPDNRAVSLSIPAENEGGQKHPFILFDIEYDSEQPDRLAICLLETNQDGFIHTVQKTMCFPARLLTELLSRRKATAQEVASWRTDEDTELMTSIDSEKQSQPGQDQARLCDIIDKLNKAYPETQASSNELLDPAPILRKTGATSDFGAQDNHGVVSISGQPLCGEADPSACEMPERFMVSAA